MKITKLFIALGIGLSVSGLAAITPLLLISRRDAKLAAQVSARPLTTKPVVVSPRVKTGKPTTLSLPSLNLNLAVTDGIYNSKTGQWTLSSNKAHYALMTVQPNDETGNTLIYGHYRPEVFARLKSIQPGGQAIVTTDNGLRFRYEFVSSRAVSPSDSSIFAYQGAPQLTIQTCSGAYMQNRQFFTFRFIAVETVGTPAI